MNKNIFCKYNRSVVITDNFSIECCGNNNECNKVYKTFTNICENSLRNISFSNTKK